MQWEQNPFFTVISITLLPFMYFRISLHPEKKMGKNTNLCPNTSSFTPWVKIPALWFSDVCLYFDRIKCNSFVPDFSVTKAVWDTSLSKRRHHCVCKNQSNPAKISQIKASLELPAMSCICYPLFTQKVLGEYHTATAQQLASVWCLTSKTHKKSGWNYLPE